MDGITILDTGEYIVKYASGFDILFFMSLSIVIIFIVTLIYFCFLGSGEDFFPIAIFFIILGIYFSFKTWQCGGEKITIPEYKVTIDSSITYKDFTNKYKVIEQEGQIYTIIDKEELATAEKK